MGFEKFRKFQYLLYSSALIIFLMTFLIVLFQLHLSPKNRLKGITTGKNNCTEKPVDLVKIPFINVTTESDPLEPRFILRVKRSTNASTDKLAVKNGSDDPDIGRKFTDVANFIQLIRFISFLENSAKKSDGNPNPDFDTNY